MHIEWDVPEGDWEAALARCPDATHFHTAGWLRAVQAGFGSAIVRARFTWPDGAWALLPLTVRPLLKGLVPLGLAGESGVFAGLVAPAPLDAARVEQAWAAVRRRWPSLRAVGNPLAATPGLPAGGERTANATHLLRLAPLEDLRAGFSRGCKARGNKARKQGLRVTVGRTPADAAIYYRLYLDSAARWGEKLTWLRPARFYEAVVREGGEVMVAWKDDEPVSALLFVHHGRAVHYLAGATAAEHLAACPSNLLMEEALARYHAAGLEVFDFGASAGLAGVKQFKEGFGAVEAPYEEVAFTHWVGEGYFALRRGVERLRAFRAGRGERSEAA